MLNYFRNKQARIIHATPDDFVRTQHMELLRSPNRLVGLIGQRGVGKTTLLLQYLKKYFTPSESLYFSADDIYIADTTLYEIADLFARFGGKVLIIDEIHKYTRWAQEIKNIYDAFPGMLIRFSGSSMLNIHYEKYDLSRRCVTMEMGTLTFAEYGALTKKTMFPSLSLDEIVTRGSTISMDLALSNPGILNDFHDYLKFGSYPFFMEDRNSFKNKLFNALQKIINEDIPSCKKIQYEQIYVFKNLIAKLIQSRVPYMVNMARLSSELGITAPTLAIYMDILKSSGIFRPIRKYSKKVSKKPNKLLFANTNILYSYAEDFGVEVDIGTARETFFSSCFRDVFYSDIGDFKVQDYIFEVGGPNKTVKQILDIDNGYLVVDTDYTTDPRKIPLWLFGLIRG